MPRVVRGNSRVALAVVHVPDAWSIQAASLGAMTNTFSPGSAGRHTSGTRRGFTGDRGYGVNRFAGRTPPKQNFYAPVGKIADPSNRLVGIGAGVAGQPGLPNTGANANGLAGQGSLAWLSFSQLAQTGF